MDKNEDILDFSNFFGDKEPIKEDNVVEPIKEQIISEPVKNIEPEEEIIEDSISEYSQEDFYTLYRDLSELFSFDISVEGADLSQTEARLIIESDDWNIIFKGEIDENGKVTIPLKKLDILKEGSGGKVKLEIIAENNVFVPWEKDFKVKSSRKIEATINEKKVIKKNIKVGVKNIK